MELVINELEKKLKELEECEFNEVVSLSIDLIVHATANSSSPLAEVSQKMEKTKAYEAIKNKSIRATPGTRESYIEGINQYNPHLYEECLKEVKKKNEKRTRAIYVLQDLLEKLKSGLTVQLVEFDVLRTIFEYINLNPNMQISTFIFFVNNNAKFYRTEKRSACMPNIKELINHKYTHITIEEVASIIVEKRLEEFFRDENPSNPLGQKELMDHFYATCTDYTDIQETCEKLDTIFNKNVSDLTEEDYDKIVELMTKLSFDSLAHRILRQLKKEQHQAKPTSELEKIIGINSYDILNKREIISNAKIEIPKKESAKTKKTPEEIKPKFSQKEINHVYYEINKLYDLDNFKARNTLSLDEIIYILSLMYSIEMDESIITRFLSSSMNQYKKNNAFTIYYQGYDKFKYLSEENPEVKEHLDMIEYILSDTSIFLCDDETYKSTKELVSEELKEIMPLINDNYTYEIEEAKKLLNTNKE